MTCPHCETRLKFIGGSKCKAVGNFERYECEHKHVVTVRLRQVIDLDKIKRERTGK